ncbi:intradiol ring-cleavage dioxygenase [Nocardioides marmorisolisilvae]|uniref:Intradiol ring-cleavage dioxygenase n=1 Tax=Nocardioides marmorisolisilvae TaxID=1542737 RepID=A0A3N0DT98_9ACTN|nr:intradiol ring-cleavage dioxygenase [Nocardioides marmorisolisilvae]RNL78867.1 intradiol ring-cleavage dioxygenase [Nocardioides marmorisolisilvae]
MSIEEIEDHDRGLSHDLPKIIEQGVARRRMFGILGGLAAAGTLAACGSSDDGSSASTSTNSGSAPGGGAPGADSNVTVADGEIPEETAGPYPGDGSNGKNVLTQSGVVRSDIRSSFAGATGVAAGVPLTLRFKVYDLSGSTKKSMSGAAVYAWHCDRDGNYSMYSDAVADQNYLRGVQVVDDDGWVEFTSIFPACYSGRWPHVHFEVYPSVDDATSASNKLRTSQLAFPKDTCETVYAEDGYEQSVSNLSQVSLDTDGIFSDGYSLQLATMTGSVAKGYVATLNVPV